MKIELKKFYLATLYSPHWRLGENMTSYLQMATVQEKAMCVLWFSETKSVIKTQRHTSDRDISCIEWTGVNPGWCISKQSFKQWRPKMETGPLHGETVGLETRAVECVCMCVKSVRASRCIAPRRNRFSVTLTRSRPKAFPNRASVSWNNYMHRAADEDANKIQGVPDDILSAQRPTM
jgi:hypothetical protein